MNNDINITIFTPTYNRANTLQRCYESIKKQNYKSFEWLIYDDGSVDNTRAIIESFIKENIIKIRYYYGENAGKHIAINKGVELANGELFFIVDSDDYLTENALEIVNNVWGSIPKKEKSSFIGIGGKKYLINKRNTNFNLNSQYYDADAIAFNFKNKKLQDKAEVYVTEKLKKYKFPEFDNENFMTEAVIWYKMAEDGYKIRWFDEYINICEYLPDGLSANFYNKRINSIKGTCYSYNQLSSFKLPLIYRIRYKINYFRYGLTKYSFNKLRKNLYKKEFIFIAYILGYLIYLNDKRKNL